MGLLFLVFAALSTGSHTDSLFSSVQNAASRFATVVAVALAIASWLTLYLFGVLVSAAGQLVRANLDTAVHTSPFLSKEARLIAMGIAAPPMPAATAAPPPA